MKNFLPLQTFVEENDLVMSNTEEASQTSNRLVFKLPNIEFLQTYFHHLFEPFIWGETNFGTDELRHCMFGTDFGNFTNFGTNVFGTQLYSALNSKIGTNKLNFGTYMFATCLTAAHYEVHINEIEGEKGQRGKGKGLGIRPRK